MKSYKFSIALAAYAALLLLVAFVGGSVAMFIGASLIGVMSLVIGGVLGYGIGDKASPEHSWYAQAVHTPSGMFGNAAAITTVLYCCRTCPDVRTETVDGVWTLDEITGGDSSADQNQAIDMVSGERP